MGKLVPAVRYNLHKIRNKETKYVLIVFNYRAFGNDPTQYRNLVPNVTVLPKFWDYQRQRVTIDRSNPTFHIKANQLLDEIEETITAIFKDFNAGCISPHDLGKELGYRLKWEPRPEIVDTKKNVTLFAFIDNFLNERTGGKRGTEKVLYTWATLLKQFSMERYQRLVNYDEVDNEFLNAFKNWCYAEPRKHSINYFAKGLTVLRQFMREAERRKYHNSRDYMFFGVKRTPTTKLALTFDELEALYQLDLANYAPGMVKARDLFLIGAYTGLRFSDFSRIRPEWLEVRDGQKILNVVTQKTDVTVSVPLLPIAATILEKYGYNVPKVANAKMNESLKELGKMAGLDKNMIVINTAGGKRNDEGKKQYEILSTHVARRSFATNFYREGIPASMLMQITGHTTERQFMNYIKIGSKENAVRFATMQAQKEKGLTVIKPAVNQ